MSPYDDTASKRGYRDTTQTQSKVTAMAATNLVQKAAPTDKRVLAPYYLYADTADLEAAVKSLTFELRVRAERDQISAENKTRSTDRLAELRAEIDAIGAPYNHEVDGL